MTEVELRQAHEMFTDLWRFYKRFCDSNNTDEYWEAVDKEAHSFHRKYQTKLAKDLITLLANDFERRA